MDGGRCRWEENQPSTTVLVRKMNWTWTFALLIINSSRWLTWKYITPVCCILASECLSLFGSSYSVGSTRDLGLREYIVFVYETAPYDDRFPTGCARFLNVWLWEHSQRNNQPWIRIRPSPGLTSTRGPSFLGSLPRDNTGKCKS